MRRREFLPRELFGQYLEASLLSAAHASPPHVLLQRIHGEVVAIEHRPDASPEILGNHRGAGVERARRAAGASPRRRHRCHCSGVMPQGLGGPLERWLED
jgi:hypothetical protein